MALNDNGTTPAPSKAERQRDLLVRLIGPDGIERYGVMNQLRIDVPDIYASDGEIEMLREMGLLDEPTEAS